MSSPTSSDAVLALGAVRTGFLAHSGQITADTARALLCTLPGEQVRTAARPRAYAVSPETLIGVDCPLPSRVGRRSRGVGTVATRTTLTGGRILQTTSYTRVVQVRPGQRRAWSHYLGRPGVVETGGKLDADDLAAGHAEADAAGPGPALDAVAEQAMNGIQDSGLLDRRVPIRTPRGLWRWCVQIPDPGGAPLYRFKVLADGTCLLRLAMPGHALADIVDLIEDLALHDWLLATVESIIERAELGHGPADRMLDRVRPVFDHMLHHWMPGARVPPRLMPVWDALDRVHGTRRQWDLSVNRVRDQLALSTITRLSAADGR